MAAKKSAGRAAKKRVAKSVTKAATKSAAKGAAKADARESDLIAGPPKANPPGLSNPAKRALNNIGVTRLSELTRHREEDLTQLHGLGPTGIKALKAALKSQGKSFHA